MSRWLVPFLAVALAGPAAAQTRLEWKFAEGDTFLLERTYAQKQVIEVNAKTFTQNTNSTWLTSVVVKEKGPKIATLLFTIEAVTIKSTGAGLEGGPDDKLAEKLKGQSYTVAITPQGRIVRLDGYEALLKKLAEGKGEMEKSLRALISEESLRDGLEEIFAFLPERPVAKGDKWKRMASETAPPFGSFKSQFDYVYEGEQNGEHTVAYTIKMTYQSAAGFTDLLRVVKGGLKSDEGSGAMVFDVATGRLLRGEKSLRIHGDLTIESLGKQTPIIFRSDHSLRIRVLPRKVTSEK